MVLIKHKTTVLKKMRSIADTTEQRNKHDLLYGIIWQVMCFVSFFLIARSEMHITP